MDRKFTSNAKWSKIPDSIDYHWSYNEAKSICNILLEDYTEEHPCPTRGVCLSAWVHEE